MAKTRLSQSRRWVQTGYLCRSKESAFFMARLCRAIFYWEEYIMPDYEKLYHLMLNASEDALEALEAGNPDWARLALLEAEQKAEDMYVEAEN